MVRLLAIIMSFLVLGIGVFLTYDYYESNLVLLHTNPSYSLDVSRTLLDYLLVAAIAGIFLLSLVIYMLMTIRVVARRMAYTMTKTMPTIVVNRMLMLAEMSRSTSVRTFCRRPSVSPLFWSSKTR